MIDARANLRMSTVTTANQSAIVQSDKKPERIGWLPRLVFFIKLARLGLSAAYSRLNRLFASTDRFGRNRRLLTGNVGEALRSDP